MGVPDRCQHIATRSQDLVTCSQKMRGMRGCLRASVLRTSAGRNNDITHSAEGDRMTPAAATPKHTEQAADLDTIRPFRVSIPEKEIVELRRRIAATRWPTRELVEDRSQGVQLATLKELARYWSTDYDWRKAEARLNAYPQFVTKIAGVRSEEHTSELQSL